MARALPDESDSKQDQRQAGDAVAQGSASSFDEPYAVEDEDEELPPKITRTGRKSAIPALMHPLEISSCAGGAAATAAASLPQ
jgi:hypothetical protein